MGLQASPYRDLVAAAFSVVGATLLIKLFDTLEGLGVIDQVRSLELSRARQGVGRLRRPRESAATASVTQLADSCLSLSPSPPFFLSRPRPQKLSRKLVHTLAGPLFILCWPLFSAAPGARLLAAAVPSLNGVRLLLVGTGAVKDARAVQAMTRTGDPRELLRGPLYYVIVLVGVTAFYWRESAVGTEGEGGRWEWFQASLVCPDDPWL